MTTDITPPPAATAPVNPGPPPTDLRSKRISFWWFLGPLALLFTVAVIFGSIAKAPYVLFAPGSALSTEKSISVPDELSNDSPGEVLFTTVSIVQRPTYVQAIWGWLRSDVDVYPFRAIYGDSTVEDNRAVGRADMNESKLLAAKVALEKLGYPVKSTGTGVLLMGVNPNAASAKVISAGDTIVGFNGQPVTIDSELVDLIQKQQPGDVVELKIEKQGERTSQTVKATLAQEQGTNKPLLGVSIQTRDLRFKLPFEVGIDSGNVGGPSAGLAFTLGTLDRLTPGSITGGKIVAVTGVIATDGRVLEVGGVEQKAIAARRAGAKLFIVPSAEYEAALKTAGNMPVVKVDTLDQALSALAKLGGNATELGMPGAKPTS